MQRNMKVILGGIILILGAIQLLIAIQPIAIDDAFVYYTYARNIVEGRFFAYDIRNIPSEGFTSLLYLVMLTPFEFVKINLPFASILLNISAIFVTILISGYLVVKAQFISQAQFIFFVSILWIFLINDKNVIENLNWGLETMLGTTVVALAGWCIYEVLNKENMYHERFLNLFFFVLFVSYITRPESIFFIGVIGTPLLLSRQVSIQKILSKIIIFAIFFAIYHGIKFLIFNDVLPTGFYRKVGDGNGINYVLEWIQAYQFWIMPLAIILVINTLFVIIKKTPISIKQRLIWFFIGILVITLLFFSKTNPLVGQNYRFLITPIFIVYASIAVILSILFEQVLSGLKDNVQSLSERAGLILLISICVIQIRPLVESSNDLVHKLNIYAKSIETTNQQTYLQFGSYLQNTLTRPEQITYIYGEAGTIPYGFNGRFIDYNGLVEPFIARLFSNPDEADRNQKFIDYVLSQQPDMVLFEQRLVEQTPNQLQHLTYEWLVPVFSFHSPFKGDFPVELLSAYHDYGLRYLCSFRTNYLQARLSHLDVHILIRLESPNYADLSQTLISYCQEHGYILPNGITLVAHNQQIEFDRAYIERTNDTIHYEFEGGYPYLVIEDGFGGYEFMNNRSYQWTLQPTTSLQFPIQPTLFNSNQDYQIQVVTIASLEEDVLDSLVISVNGTRVNLSHTPQGDSNYFEGIVLGNVLTSSTVEIIFQTDRVSIPSELGIADGRTLGIALDWLKISPISQNSDS